jgi:hypothetical protein
VSSAEDLEEVEETGTSQAECEYVCARPTDTALGYCTRCKAQVNACDRCNTCRSYGRLTGDGQPEGPRETTTVNTPQVVIPTRVYEWREGTQYKTVVIDRWDSLRCAAPCNNDPYSSGFEYLPSEPTMVALPEGTDLEGIYVCLACDTVIDIKPVPAWDTARQAAEERRPLGHALLNRDKQHARTRPARGGPLTPRDKACHHHRAERRRRRARPRRPSGPPRLRPPPRLPHPPDRRHHALPPHPGRPRRRCCVHCFRPCTRARYRARPWSGSGP